MEKGTCQFQILTLSEVIGHRVYRKPKDRNAYLKVTLHDQPMLADRTRSISDGANLQNKLGQMHRTSHPKNK
jgi:hypothetical protein